MHEGYFKLYRSILNHRYFADAEKLRFWIWCLLRANHKTNKVIIGNETIILEPGQFITGRKAASEELKISEMTFRSLLNFFSEKEKKLTKKTTNKYTVITVNGYNSYNFVENESNQECNQQLTNKQPTTNQQLTTDNNVKNVNNDKNDKKLINNIVLPDWIPKETWDIFLEVRKAKKCPNTARALNMLINKMSKFRDRGIDIKEEMERSILNGWKDIYEPRKGNNYGQTGRSKQSLECEKGTTEGKYANLPCEIIDNTIDT